MSYNYIILGLKFRATSNQPFFNLQDMGENIYTIPEVVHEIRDSTTRQRLQVLPYDLKLKEPLPEDIQFSKHLVCAEFPCKLRSIVFISFMYDWIFF